MVAYRAWHRGGDRLGHLHRHRHGHLRGKVRRSQHPQYPAGPLPLTHTATGRAARRRSGDRSFAGSGSHRLRAHRPLLCRTRVHDSHCRLGLYLHLRHHGRADRLDHRLGSDPRICRLQHDRQRGFCRSRGRPAGLVRPSPVGHVDLARLSAGRIAGSGRQLALPPRLALRLQHSRLSHRPVSHRHSGARHPRVGQHQQHHGVASSSSPF